MSHKVKRDAYSQLIEETMEALPMTPIQTFEKEIPDKPKRKLRVSISVAVSSGSNEAAGAAESKSDAPDAGCQKKSPPPKPPRYVARSPLEEPFSGDMESVGATVTTNGLYSSGLSEQRDCPDNCRYPCCRAFEDSTMHDYSLDGCSLAGDTNSVDTFPDDWTDSVSSYIPSRCFVTRLVNCFCCLKPHDD